MSGPGREGRRRTVIVVVAVVVVLVLAVAGIMEGVRNHVANSLVNESATLDEAILQQGTVYTADKGGLIRIPEYDVIIGIAEAGRDSDSNPGARLSFVSSTDTSIGRNEWVPLGGSFTVAKLGTVYVVSLSSFEHVQRVSVLYIPES